MIMAINHSSLIDFRLSKLEGLRQGELEVFEWRANLMFADQMRIE